MTVTERRDGKIQFALVVPLAEELLAHLETPLPTDLPGSARVRDVRTLESDLQHQVAVLTLTHIQGIGVQVSL